MQSLYFNIFLFLGTIASIISLLIGLWKYGKLYQILNIIIVVVLSVFASYSFLSYQQLRDKKEGVRREATNMLEGMPSRCSYNEPGRAKGIVLAGLALLEQHRELYPETYLLVKTTIVADIQSAQAVRNTSEEKYTLEEAGNSMLKILEALAGKQKRIPYGE